MIRIIETTAMLGSRMPLAMKNKKDDQAMYAKVSISAVRLTPEQIDQLLPTRVDERRVSELLFSARGADSEFRHFKVMQLGHQIHGAKVDIRLPVVDEAVEILDATLSAIKIRAGLAGECHLDFSAEWRPRKREHDTLMAWLGSECYVALRVEQYGDQLEV